MREQAEKLPIQRKARGLTQAECAQLVGVTETCWRHWEHARTLMPQPAARLWSVIVQSKREEMQP